MGQGDRQTFALLLLLLGALGLGCRRPPLGLNDQDDGGAPDARLPVACPVLQPLADRGPLTARRTHSVAFPPDGRAVALLGPSDGTNGAIDVPDDLLVVALPGGNVTASVPAIGSAAWLGVTGALLVTGNGAQNRGDLSIVAADGRVRLIAGGTCGHLVTADAARVYFLRACTDDLRSGALDALEVSSGAISQLAPAALAGSLAASPNGRWLAYLAPDVPSSPPGGTLHVIDVGGPGGDTAVARGTRAVQPAFIENGQLLFRVSAFFGPTDVYRYFVAGGEAAAIARGVDPGPAGYQVSPGLSFLLAARWAELPPTPNRLVSFTIDGGHEAPLASDLVASQLNELGPAVFAFNHDGGRAIYVSDRYAGISAVPSNGAPSARLSAGSAFALSPDADRLAIFEEDAMHDRRRLHVRSSVPGPDSFVYETTARLKAPSFVAEDRGLVFVEAPANAPAELRYLAFSDGAVSSLGRWTQSDLPPAGAPLGLVTAGYPLDPSGCFTIVDSDLPGVEGTSLVLLPR